MNALAARSTFDGPNPSAPPKLRIAKRSSQGEDEARFASVVLPHLAEAHTLARCLTGNPSDAEDVVQNACLRAFGGIGNFRKGNARAWVLTIVRHTALSWLRKNRGGGLVLVEDLESIENPQSSHREFETPETALLAEDGDEVGRRSPVPTPFRETLTSPHPGRQPRNRRGDWRAGRHGDVAPLPRAGTLSRSGERLATSAAITPLPRRTKRARFTPVARVRGAAALRLLRVGQGRGGADRAGGRRAAASRDHNR
jgi:RNA polymerase sigma-70 factor (ECF subfamily)